MVDKALLDSRIESVFKKFQTKQEQTSRYNYASFLINLWIECEKVLLDLYKEDETKNKYFDNVFSIIFTISNIAISEINNSLLAGRKDALFIERFDSKYGDKLIDEYSYLFDRMKRVEKDKYAEEMFDKKQEEFNSLLHKLNEGNNSGCYIATMAYGDYDHQQVLELRKFRDDFLSKTIVGRNFIKIYYKYSPSLVEKLKNKERINLIIRKGLNQFIKAIRK